MCGEVKSKEKDKTASTPLVTVSDLQRLNKFEIIVLRRRLFPYKTRFQTDFEVDWGRTYPKAVPPTRERRPVELFDIREYVKAKKKEKMEAMGMGDLGSGNPFGIGNPFVGANPFGGNPFMGGAPNFMKESTNNGNDLPNGNDSFNIDDLVKKIDAKIAEIEKEEEDTKKRESTAISDLIPNKDVIDIPNNDIVEQKEVSVSSIDKMYDESTSDDDFFDDFFSDD